MKNYTEFFIYHSNITNPQGWEPGRGGRMGRFAITTGFILILAFSLAGCGGGSSSSSANKVTSVTLSSSMLSLNAGEVVQIIAAVTNAAGNGVTTTVTFTSSNSNIAGVSPAALNISSVCGGTWDSAFIVCNGLSGGVPVTGTATITATAGGVTSSPLTVSVHPKVTSVTVSGFPVFCASTTQQIQLTSKAFNGSTDITSQVGQFSWTSLDPSVASVDTNGAVTAKNPGVTGIFANVASVSSTTTSFRTCMPTRIRAHAAADSSITSATLSATQTQALAFEFDDENGVTIFTGDPFIKVSNNPVSATVSGTTITAVSPGGAGIVAACIPPTCGNGLNTPIYSNVFGITVTGTSRHYGVRDHFFSSSQRQPGYHGPHRHWRPYYWHGDQSSRSSKLISIWRSGNPRLAGHHCWPGNPGSRSKYCERGSA